MDVVWTYNTKSGLSNLSNSSFQKNKESETVVVWYLLRCHTHTQLLRDDDVFTLLNHTITEIIAIIII